MTSASLVKRRGKWYRSALKRMRLKMPMREAATKVYMTVRMLQKSNVI
jgi:hypothetical protein